jgi:hypothetical protein
MERERLSGCWQDISFQVEVEVGEEQQSYSWSCETVVKELKLLRQVAMRRREK